MQPAALPTQSAAPGLARQTAIGLFLGLLIGIAVAFYVEARSNRFRRTTELENIVGGHVLGVVPAADGLVVAAGTTGVEAEAFRKLRTRVQFMTAQQGLRSLAITSAVETDVRSTMVANLSAALALAGVRVALVSADLRAAAVEKIVGTKRSPGLSEWLSGANAEPMSLAHESRIEGLRVLPAGDVTSGSSELIASPLLGELILQLNKQFDLTILDTPPAIATADARIVGAAVDGVVVAIDARRDAPPVITSKSRLARDEIENVGGNVVGYVVISELDDAPSNP
ncbi:MAG: polysaccharide biosynthesis tyrosine autokinase [Actinomycetota bacterium]